MRRLTIEQKKEYLSNALKSYDFNEKYFIETSDRRLGHRFAIASKTSHGGIQTHTNYMDYEQMNCYLFGYIKSINNPFL
jgi:hypothetical protein